MQNLRKKVGIQVTFECKISERKLGYRKHLNAKSQRGVQNLRGGANTKSQRGVQNLMMVKVVRWSYHDMHQTDSDERTHTETYVLIKRWIFAG